MKKIIVITIICMFICLSSACGTANEHPYSDDYTVQQTKAKNENTPVTNTDNLTKKHAEQANAGKTLVKNKKEKDKAIQKANEKKKEAERKSHMEYIGYFEVTAYSYAEGDGENYQTAGGYTPSPYYTVAVDPSVIPLGTRLYIEGIGEVQAQDTGGAVQGNIIDYHIGYDNCDSFGRQELKVYIIN
jgi:3D (Asp-Asp-Asp) domain-containing protein